MMISMGKSVASGTRRATPITLHEFYATPNLIGTGGTANDTGNLVPNRSTKSLHTPLLQEFHSRLRIVVDPDDGLAGQANSLGNLRRTGTVGVHLLD